jgi:hypothetical protein
MWSGADSLRPDWLSMSVRSRPSSEQCPRDGVPSEEPGRQGAKREAVSAPTSRQAEWSGGAWPREQVQYTWGFSVSRAEPNLQGYHRVSLTIGPSSAYSSSSAFT